MAEADYYKKPGEPRRVRQNSTSELPSQNSGEGKGAPFYFANKTKQMFERGKVFPVSNKRLEKKIVISGSGTTYNILTPTIFLLLLAIGKNFPKGGCIL